VLYCSIKVVSLTGTHTGNNVTFSWVMENGLSFSFTGVYAQSSNTGRKFLNGISSGATLPPIGTTFEREGN
jgi:hypothetical protein